MAPAKKGRPVSLFQTNKASSSKHNTVTTTVNNNTTAVVLGQVNDISSGCSSDGGSPRRKLELDDEGSQSVLFDPSNPIASTSGEVCYDPSDHTVIFPRDRLSSHMMVLPRSLLCNTDTTTINSNSGPQASGTNSSIANHQRSSPAATAADGIDAMCASPGTEAPMPSTSWRDVSIPRPLTSLRPGCVFVRLEHPRHGEPTLFLCPPPPLATEAEAAGNDCNTGAALDVPLYEVQAQTPLGGFGQTWFVDNMVEPNEELLIVTPFDITFFALRQAATNVMKEKFLSAEDLIMGANRNGNNARSNGWPGWGVAVAQCPELAPAVAAMQSKKVLSRICEVKSIGGDDYYRFSEEKMGAWLREKLLNVLHCPALSAVLQIDTNATSCISDTSSAGGSRGTASAVPFPVAFGVVAEYVVEAMITTAAELCAARDNADQRKPHVQE